MSECIGKIWKLDDEERALIGVGLAELDRGEVATDAQVRAVFDKYRALPTTDLPNVRDENAGSLPTLDPADEFDLR